MGDELDDLKAKATELAASFIGSLQGRAKELYESRMDVRDLIIRTTRNAAKLGLELVTEKDEDRRESIRMSLQGAEDTGLNEAAALFQDAATEASSAIKDAFKMIFGFLKEAAPMVVSWALKAAAHG